MRRAPALTGITATLALLSGLTAWGLTSYEPQIIAFSRNVTLYDRTNVRFGLVDGVELEFGTSVQVGADGRVFATDQAGYIYAYTMERGPFGSVVATSSERIDIIRELPNHNDDGTLNPDVEDRLITGMLSVGSPDQPALYISSSDPRTYNRAADSNSGVVSLLSKQGDAWHRRDVVCGLPRSHADHATNGLYFDAANRMLYVLQGGNTNSGAPSEGMSNLPEYALSGALLQIDLDRISDDCYKLPTLDDPARPGADDPNDPYGGAHGDNQAYLDPSSPVTIYASGLRNPYRLVPMGDGFLTIDNGPDQFYGGVPIWDGDRVTNRVSLEDGDRLESPMLLLSEGAYYGHPNPTRANRRNTFAGQSPVPSDDSRQAHFVAPPARPGLRALFARSVNGLAWYPTEIGPEAWRGKLVVVGFDREIRLLGMNETGHILSSDTLVRQAASTPLDVAVSQPGQALAGTIWVVDYASGRLIFVQPSDPNPGIAEYLTTVWRECCSAINDAVRWYYGVEPSAPSMTVS